MFICGSCGRLKEELGTRQESHPYGDGVAYETWAEDCSCGGDYVEAVACPICKTWYDESEMTGICENCQDDVLDKDTMLEYIKQKNMRYDFFVVWWIGVDIDDPNEKILELCEKDWSEENEDVAVKELHKFVKDDIERFVDWYTKKEVM